MNDPAFSLPSDGPVLPQSSRQMIQGLSDERCHPGLRLDRYAFAGTMEEQRGVLEKVCRAAGDAALLSSALERRRATMSAIGATSIVMTTSGPLTLHLSRTGSMENAGISLHPVYGFACLPASGMKGMTRAWAETVWLAEQGDRDAALDDIRRVFGWSSGDGGAAGSVVFHDAWPQRWPRLIVDIANNHNVDYYNGVDDAGDWHDPNPVSFLAINAGETFECALSLRHDGCSAGDIALAQQWLVHALTWEGAGAKTASGYGRFDLNDHESAAPPNGILASSDDLRLSSPAFLAGSSQSEADCDLRPATVKGLLRWWWRTMHADAVDSKTMLALEGLLWGDTNRSGAARIFLKGNSGNPQPMQHPDKRDKQFLDAHDIRPPGRGKVTQGLFYASYGMAEQGRFRWYRPQGSGWSLNITARDIRAGDPFGHVSRELVLEQARCALWLMCRYGGVGSRSRKGFGSFLEIEVEGIASVDDCMTAARRFRDACGVVGVEHGSCDTPSIANAEFAEWETPWRDPWFVLEQTGMSLQLFIKGLPGEDRAALGLPRRVGRPAKSLSVPGIKTRHASPAMFSVTRGSNGSIKIRLAAFAAPRLGGADKSRDIMKRFVDAVNEELTDRVRRFEKSGRRAFPAGSASGAQHSSATVAPGGLEKGTFVECVLLEEKTKRGGWRARHEPSGKDMTIQNTADVPPDSNPGDRVELYVFSSDAFMWPNDALRQRVEKQRSQPQQNRGGNRGRRR